MSNIPQSPTFLQTLNRLNSIVSQHSTKLAGGSLSDGLLDAKKRIRTSEESAKQFRNALKTKADTKEVDKAWREFKKKQSALQKTTDAVKKTADSAKKTGGELKKIIDNLKSGNWKAISPFMAKAFGLLMIALTVFNTILGFANKIALEQINEATINQFAVLSREFSLQFNLIQSLFSRTKQLEKELTANTQAINVINAAVGQTRKFVMDRELRFQTLLQQTTIKFNSDLQSLKNNLTAVVRQTTINQQQLFNNFQSLKQRVDSLNLNNSDKQLLNRVQVVESRITTTQTIIKTVEAKQNKTETRVTALEAKVSKPDNPDSQNQLLENLKNRLNDLSTRLTGVNNQVEKLETNLPEKITKVAEPLAVKLVNGKVEQLNKDLGIKIDKKIDQDKLITTIQSQGGNIVRVLEPYLKPIVNQQTAGLANAIPALSGGIQAIANDLNKLKFDIDKLKVRKVSNQPPVDLSPVLRRLDQTDARIALIPALVLAPLGRNLDQLRQGMPTIDQIGSAAATANCRTLQPGGCTRKALDDLGNSIKSNQNQNANNLLNALNAGQNAAQLALLNRIDGKLGPQLPGGISSFLQNFLKRLNKLAEWLHLDRALNILIWWQTLHNATMLSNNVVQTLASSMDNVLNFLQIKNLDGSAISINEIVGKAYTDMMKSALGEATYNNVNKLFNSANRIYQAATNIVNAIQNINQAILGALEIIGASVARIANALKASGTVLENALQFMNPSPMFNNKLFTFLERLDQNASTIEQVTQAPLEVREAVDDLKQQKRDILEATKDGENALKGLGIIESENEKKKSLESKAASPGKELAEIDLVDAEEVA